MNAKATQIRMVLRGSCEQANKYSTTTALVNPNWLSNLRTHWRTNIPWQYAQLSFGQIYDYDSPNQHGDRAYLWSTYTDTFGASYNYTMQNGTSYAFNAARWLTVWQMYNAFTGNWICNIANVPSGTTCYGPTGELLIYIYNSAGGYLTLWNSSKPLNFQTTTLACHTQLTKVLKHSTGCGENH